MADEPVNDPPNAEPKEPADDPSIGGPDPTPEGEDNSLAAHEAAFGDKAEGEKQPASPRILKRHRAEKDKASKADVPRIQELTRKLREAEAKLAEKGTASAPEPAQTVSPPAPGRGASPATLPGLRPKPSEDEVGGKYESYADFVEDLSDWRAEARDAQAKVAKETEAAQATEAKRMERFQTAHKAYNERAAAYVKQVPDFPEKVAKLGTLKLGPLSLALMELDNGPALVDTLVSTPHLAIEASNFWGDKPTSDDYVALATQWLTSRVQPGSTGAGAVTSSQSAAPTPPTPVRTGAMTLGDRPPGDDASIRDHERAYYPQGSLRRRR